MYWATLYARENGDNKTFRYIGKNLFFFNIVISETVGKIWGKWPFVTVKLIEPF